MAELAASARLSELQTSPAALKDGSAYVENSLVAVFERLDTGFAPV